MPIVGFDVEHPVSQSLPGEPGEAVEQEFPAKAAAVEVGVHGDRVDLAGGWCLVGVDLRPAEAGQSAFEFEQAESIGVEPGLGAFLCQFLVGEVALVGVPVECPVVDLEEGIGVR